MKGALLSLWVLPGLCAGTVLAQSQLVRPAPQTVPTRIAVAEYGEPSGNPCGLRLGCSLWEQNGTAIRVAGGVPDALAVVLAGAGPANIKIPGLGTLLVATPVYPVYGYFDVAGAVNVPLDLARPDLVGLNLHLQAWQSVDGWGFEHSAGLRVSYRPGNAQPPLTYAGPPLKAVLCRFEGPTQSAHVLLARFTVPSSGFKADLRSIVRDGATTRVHVGLVHPTGPTMTIIEEHRVIASLDADPGAKVELWIEETIQDCVCITLAAVIETRF